MSCNSCGGCGCSQCDCDCECDPAHEPLSSALDNFIVAFFGEVTKSCVNNEIVWSLPCDLDSGIEGFPRLANEGIACYLLRIGGEGAFGTVTIQTGSTAIPVGLDVATVVFPTAFASIPTIRLTIARPTGGDLIYANLNSDSVTVNGFTADLSNVVPDGNYTIQWEANS